MRRLKKIISYIGIIALLLILFRGFIYRKSVHYTQVKTRNNISLTNKTLTKSIDKELKNKILNIDEIIELSNQITSKKLSFTFGKASSNPNLVHGVTKANCIGYSALFNSIGNYIIAKQKMTDTYEFEHLVAKLDFFGIDVHKAFNSPFFKDHDYNEVKFKKTGESKFVDPSLSDYLKIRYIKSE
ncbi:hypothetical protein M4I21_12340 [Cellulophaga sp. 20_2_10]|uniref:hypothetical protein n=1 Tax=Cellulophaga sp. 20_2_10 TaxID=2942476 RepID=UPI00201AC9A6|nr:hypothetical protein [Cellulophaga sp. 20_2_10]MCL5246605.1 hypothetical protein [Cellulophaga sp. 20_2_10]